MTNKSIAILATVASPIFMNINFLADDEAGTLFFVLSLVAALVAVIYIEKLRD